jgi:hypothetical protein
MATKAERQHKDKLAALGCVACLKLHDCTTYAVELHHLRTGGWGKGDYKTLMPLCWTHHHSPQFGVHGMGTKLFDRYYGDVERFGDRAFTQQSLLAYALERIA